MKEVLVLHDDGRWWPADLLDQRQQPDGSWRCSVGYSTGPGQSYRRSVPATQVRAVDDPPDGWTDPRRGPPAEDRPRPWLLGG